MKKEVNNPALRTWVALNDILREADEKLCRKLLADEITGRDRKAYIKRIHCRLNKVRADREREELGINETT